MPSLKLTASIIASALCWTAWGVPSIPPPVGENASALQDTISAAIASSQRVVRIPPGKYVFSDTSVTISGAQDMVIHAGGVTFVFYYGSGLTVSECHNLTVRGLTLDSDPPNYAQGTITASVNGTDFVARFDDRFIPPDTGVQPFSHAGGQIGAKVSFWDAKTKQLHQPHKVNFMSASEAQGDDLFRISLRNPAPQADLAVGTAVTIFPRRGWTFRTLDSSNVVVQDVTIHAGGNMGFLEQGGEGGHVYRRVAIARKPGSAGLLALNADGFHSSDVGTGPTLEDSEISFTGDDFLNIHNKMLVICKSFGSAAGVKSLAIVDLSVDSLSNLRKNDELRFYKLLSGTGTKAHELLGSGFVNDSALGDDSALSKECSGIEGAMSRPPYSATFANNIFKRARVYRVTFLAPLDPAIVASRYNLANFERRSAVNAKVRRNHFHDAAGSGGRILAKAFNFTFEDNVVERFGGLHVENEQNWMEGALGIRNVYFRNNTVVDDSQHITVMSGVANVTCVDTTYVSHGSTTHEATGCSFPSGQEGQVLI